MHALHTEQLYRPLQHVDVVCDDNLVERQVIFEQRFVFSHDDATSARTERCQDVVLGKVDGELNKLFMQFFDSLLRILIEGLLEGDRDVGVKQVDIAIVCVLDNAQID
jgi:hypothetical protein